MCVHVCVCVCVCVCVRVKTEKRMSPEDVDWLFFVCRKINGLYCKSQLAKLSTEPFLLKLAVCLIEIMSDNKKNGSCLVKSPLEMSTSCDQFLVSVKDQMIGTSARIHPGHAPCLRTATTNGLVSWSRRFGFERRLISSPPRFVSWTFQKAYNLAASDLLPLDMLKNSSLYSSSQV